MAANLQGVQGIETIRFRRPQTQTEKVTPLPKPKNRHAGILQDQLRR